MISREDFIKIIQDVKATISYHDRLNSFFRKNDVDGYIYQPDCTDTVIKTLHLFMENKDDDMIGYFCFELDFGKEWKPGVITDKDGSDIKLADAGDLYDYLTKGSDN